MSKHTPCKYDEHSGCRFLTNFADLGKEKPELTDCLVCFSANFEFVAKALARIIACVGAQEHADEFLIMLARVFAAKDSMLRMLQEEYSEMYELIMERMEREPIILGVDGVPPELLSVIEEIRKRKSLGRI